MIEIEKWCQYKRSEPVIMSEEERKLQETSHDHFNLKRLHIVERLIFLDTK